MNDPRIKALAERLADLGLTRFHIGLKTGTLDRMLAGDPFILDMFGPKVEPESHEDWVARMKPGANDSRGESSGLS
jgi:hypothetical protein